MAVRPGMVAVVLGTCLIAAAYVSAFLPWPPPRWAAMDMVLGTALLLAGLMAVGAARPGRPMGRLLWPIAFTFVALVGCLGLALMLPGAEGPGTRLWAGLPRRAALVIYGVGLLPALILPLAYALTFREHTLDRNDVERIRAARSAAGPADPESAS
ncbi:MAG TPA: hypothetical protein VF187_00465 [Gemmatimonadales bacterium]